MAATSINVTSIDSEDCKASKPRLRNTEPRVMFTQEHAVSDTTQANMIAEFGKKGWSMAMRPYMPECNRRTGGVAVAAVRPLVVEKSPTRDHSRKPGRRGGLMPIG